VKSDRATALTLILAHEGGKVDHPKDPGGRTAYGITQRTYDAWLSARGRPSVDVWKITQSEVRAIYGTQYLDRVRYEQLPAGINYAVADFAVNSGVSRAVKTLQRIIGVKQDGVVGEITLAKLRELRGDTGDTYDLIVEYCNARMSFLRSLKTWGTFGRGWTSRVMGKHDGVQKGDHGVIDYACAMLVGGVDLPTPSAVGSEKAEAKDIKASSTVEGVGIAAAGAAGVAELLRQTAAELGPLAKTPVIGDTIQMAASGLGVAAAMILLYSALRALRTKRAEG